MADVRFPWMRREIIEAVRVLSDPAYQWSAWVRRDLPPGVHDNFTLRVHVLYDDTEVLPDPSGAVGDLLESAAEAEALRALGEALDAVFRKLGTGRPDEDYLRADDWDAVVARARTALRTMAPAAR